MKKTILIALLFAGPAMSATAQNGTTIKKTDHKQIVQTNPAKQATIKREDPSVLRMDGLNKLQRKRKPLTTGERLKRDLTNGKRSGVFLAAIMHSLDRVSSGETNKTEFDIMVEKAVANNSSFKEKLTKMLAAYKTIPVEIRSKSMPMELAKLDLKTGLSFAEVNKLIANPYGANIIIKKRNPLTTVPKLPVTLKDEYPAAPRIDAFDVVENTDKKLILHGAFFGSTPIVPIYIKPEEGQSLDDVFFQRINKDKVAVVWGKVNEGRTVIETILPVGLTPGNYSVSVMVPRSPTNEPISNTVTLSLAPYAYTFRMLSIKCIDESNPETFIGTSVSDEILIGWASFADKGFVHMGTTLEYDGFDDGVEKILQIYPRNDGTIFPNSETEAGAGMVANRLFLNFLLWEMDNSLSIVSLPDVITSEAVFLDLGRAGLDADRVTFEQERLSQILYNGMETAFTEGSHDLIGEVRLSFSAGELQQLTNNEGGRYRGEMQFNADDATGSYVVYYEILRKRVF